MKIHYRQPLATADVSAARERRWRELGQLLVMAALALVAIYFAVGFAVDFLVSRISYEREAKLFAKVRLAPAMGYQVAEDPAARERVEAVLGRLTGLPAVAPLNYSVVVLETDEANAFAFPGGIIAVTTGLLDLVDDELELAFVLGHELGHFRNRDHLHNLGRALGFGALYGLIFGAGVDGDSFAPIVSSVLRGAYSRQQEAAADVFGLQLLYLHYGRVDGFDTLFQHLRRQLNSPRWLAVFATHPHPEDRIERLQRYFRELEAQGEPSN